MSPGLDAARARRYLLGQASEEERAALELEYFRSEESVDRIAAAEDDLIEDYLSDRLDPVERGLFERDYLAAPNHRRRVETIRQLLASTSRTEPKLTMNWSRQWLALAAALVLFAAGSLWIYTSPRGERGTLPSSPSPGLPGQPPTSAPAAPRVFAVSISPVTVRSAAGAPAVIVPAGTDIVALSLEGVPDSRTGGGGRASIRTVSGDEIWQGPATVTGDLPAGVIARIDVPAARLPADDYVVTVYGTEYFLRVRAR